MLELQGMPGWKLLVQDIGGIRDGLMKALLDACSDVVPGIHTFEVALAKPDFDCTYDVVLYSEFDSLAALQAYQDHPQHVALKPFVGAVRLDRQCMDYEIQ
jgi:hypothetical protein